MQPRGFIFRRRSKQNSLAIDGYYLTAEDIDGYYKATEDIGGALRNGPAQAWLDGDTIRITPLA